MSRYIDADNLEEVKEIMYDVVGDGVYAVRMSDVREQPTADVVDRARYKQLLENSTIMADALKEYENEDVVEVVRCKDCRHWVSNMRGCGRNPSVESWKEDDYCSYGERREDE